MQREQDLFRICDTHTVAHKFNQKVKMASQQREILLIQNVRLWLAISIKFNTFWQANAVCCTSSQREIGGEKKTYTDNQEKGMLSVWPKTNASLSASTCMPVHIGMTMVNHVSYVVTMYLLSRFFWTSSIECYFLVMCWFLNPPVEKSIGKRDIFYDYVNHIVKIHWIKRNATMYLRSAST